MTESQGKNRKWADFFNNSWLVSLVILFLGTPLLNLAKNSPNWILELLNKQIFEKFKNTLLFDQSMNTGLSNIILYFLLLNFFADIILKGFREGIRLQKIVGILGVVCSILFYSLYGALYSLANDDYRKFKVAVICNNMTYQEENTFKVQVITAKTLKEGLQLVETKRKQCK